MRGHLTEKTDVFAFGVVALEIISGRSNSDTSLEEEKVYLLELVRKTNFINCFTWFLNELFFAFSLDFCIVSTLTISIVAVRTMNY